MKRQWAWLLVAIILLAARGASAANRPLAALIERAVHSEKSIAYQGIQLIEERGSRGRIATVRKVWFDRGRSRIELMDPRIGLERVLIDDGQFSLHIVPRLGMYVQVPVDLGQELERRALMLRSMFSLPQTRITGEESFLGRMCTVVESRTDTGASIVWLDQETGLPLKIDRHGANGQLTYRLAFADVEFVSGLPADTFKAPISSGMQAYSRPLVFERDVHLKVLSRDAGTPVYIPRGIPEAARLSESEVMRFQGRPLIHIQFRLKNIVLSLFQLTDDEDSQEVREGIRSKARRAEGTGKLEIFEWRTGGRRFVLIGNLPAAQLQRIAMTELEEYVWE